LIFIIFSYKPHSS